jgi:hypothetical protein
LIPGRRASGQNESRQEDSQGGDGDDMKNHRESESTSLRLFREPEYDDM